MKLRNTGTAGIPSGRGLLVVVEFRNFQAALLHSKDRNKLLLYSDILQNSYRNAHLSKQQKKRRMDDDSGTLEKS